MMMSLMSVNGSVEEVEVVTSPQSTVCDYKHYGIKAEESGIISFW